MVASARDGPGWHAAMYGKSRATTTTRAVFPGCAKRGPTTTRSNPRATAPNSDAGGYSLAIRTRLPSSLAFMHVVTAGIALRASPYMAYTSMLLTALMVIVHTYT